MSKGILIVLIIVVLLLVGYIWRDELPWLQQAIGKLDLQETMMPPGVPGKHSSNVAFYRWQDDEGVWQYDTRPPESGQPFERVLIDPDTNLIHGEALPNQ